MPWETILVTGGCGFIGTNFIRFLFDELKFSGQAINVDRLSYAANPKNLLDIQERYGDRYILYPVDICDESALSEVFQKHPIAAICHLAAESHVDRSIRTPRDFVQTNVVGTVNLLEMAKTHQLDLYHHVSTDEVYGSLGDEGKFTEDSQYRPNSPYSASKASSDHLVRAYCHTYGLPTTISNCSNNYGPYQFPEKLIPLMILRALNWESLPIYGDGGHVRDWIHVEDHCRAIWTIMLHGQRGETYNVGGEAEMQNLSMAEKICDIIDEFVPAPYGRSRRDFITFVKDRPGHDRRYAMDNTKISGSLGWRPRQTIEKGLRETVHWYLNHQAWVKQVQSGEYLRWIQDHYGISK
jgi:dTDP-glucose 4,6-dehydratase